MRLLRDEAKKLQAQHTALIRKWQTEIPSESLLLTACETAKQRWITSQYESEQQRLKDQLLLQQLYLASLQSALTESPLARYHTSTEIFEAIHDPIHLRAADGNDKARMERLLVRSDLALRVAPSLIHKFTGMLTHRATSLLPFATTNVTADHRFTYMSSAAVTKIEGTTVQSVFSAVLHFFGQLDMELSAHYEVTHSITVRRVSCARPQKSSIEPGNSTVLLCIVCSRS